MGHYKTAAKDEILTYVHTTIINLALTAGRSLPRWQHSVNIMIEKDKNSPKIDRLRILQLFEADMNMFLKVLIGDQMMFLQTNSVD